VLASKPVNPVVSILSVAGVLLAIYLIVCLIAYVGQRQLIYHPVERIWSDPAAAGLSFRADTLTAADGSRFLLWRIGESDTTNEIIVYFHGNAENISHNIDRYQLFVGLGAAVWAVEYRGYAGVGKSPDEEGIERDLDAVVAYLQKELRDDGGRLTRRIIPYGRSLGGGVAVKLATRIPVDGIILESTFSSMHDVARASFSFLPTGLLLREHYRSEEIVSELSCPKLIMHSVDDDVIPYALGRKLFMAAKEPKQFVELSGRHNAPSEVTRTTVERELSRFLAESRRNNN
jgi:hypothetical protein